MRLSDLKYKCKVQRQETTQNEYGGNEVQLITEFETPCALFQEKSTKISAIGLDIDKTYYTITIKEHPDRKLDQTKIIAIGERRFTPVGTGIIKDKYQSILTIEVQ